MCTLIGKHLFYAKEDAAIDAVSQLLDINLKSFVPPSKSKLYGEIMRKIKLDEVLLKSAKKTYEMSVKVKSFVIFLCSSSEFLNLLVTIIGSSGKRSRQFSL